MTPYSSQTMAKSFLLLAEPHGVNHLKLQKLLFLAYGWWWTQSTAPLITQAPQVYPYGPVFDDLYTVLQPNKDSRLHPGDLKSSAAPITDLATWSFLRGVWARYGALGALELAALCHCSSSPWAEEAKEHGYRVPKNHPIPDWRIRRFFQKLAKDEPLILSE